MGSQEFRLSHMLYAYDVVFVSDWGTGEVEKFPRLLHEFYSMFGLKLNIHKSHLYGVGVD